MLDDIQLLVYAGDASFPGLNRVLENDLLAVNEDVSLLRSMDTGQYLDQSGFAGAVFSDQTVDLTGPDANGHIFQCDDTRKKLGNIPQFDDVFAHVITSIPFS